MEDLPNDEHSEAATPRGNLARCTDVITACRTKQRANHQHLHPGEGVPPDSFVVYLCQAVQAPPCWYP